MALRPRQWLLDALGEDELGRAGRRLLGGAAVRGLRPDEIREAMRRSRDASFGEVLEALRSDALARLLGALELPAQGTRPERISRLLTAADGWEFLFEADEDEEWTPENFALDALPRAMLLRVAERLGLRPPRGARVADLRALLEDTPALTFEAILASLPQAGLRRLCDVFELPRSGTVSALRERLLEARAEWYEELKGEESGADVEISAGEAQTLAELVDREFVLRLDQRGERRAYQEEAVRRLLRRLDPDEPILLHVATGGGKTWIANDTVVRWHRRHPARPVLWVTKDWRLLWQAARDLTRRHKGMRERIARIGGRQGPLRALPRATNQATVVYTTVQTLASQIGRRMLRSFRPGLLVWDECHWGQGGSAGRRIVRWCRQRRVSVLGLTATPRSPEHSVFKIAYRKGFPELVEAGYLARPVQLDPVRTGVEWRPDRLRDGDFRQDSLRELAADEGRNRLIASHYAQHRQRYGQTILFACSIEHADQLATLLARSKGVAARPVHSGQDERANQRYLEQFRRGEVKVLVNVAMLTHGVDVPEARTVFLCRPTLSDVLFSQMVGRAARRMAGKDEFFIVEFTDNVARYGAQLRTAQEYFKGTGWDRNGRCRPGANGGAKSARQPSLRRHGFDPFGAPTFIPDDPAVDEAVRGLWYRAGQTFGLEIELTTEGFVPDREPDADWAPRAEALLEALRDALPEGTVAEAPFAEYHALERNDDVWNVEWDRSCGWEVTSRVLKDQAGYEEVVDACDALGDAARRAGLVINFRTGLHVHLGWMGRTVRDVRRAIELVRLFEPALATLVSPSRLMLYDDTWYDPTRPNRFCRPVSAIYSSRALARATTIERLWELSERRKARHLTFNVRPIDEIHTVETRLHNGTLDAGKILLWVSLWQQMLWCAASPRKIPAVPDTEVLRPDGDIVELARRYLPAGGEETFLRRLDERRREVLRLWRRHPLFRDWLEFRRGWTTATPD